MKSSPTWETFFSHKTAFYCESAKPRPRRGRPAKAAEDEGRPPLGLEVQGRRVVVKRLLVPPRVAFPLDVVVRVVAHSAFEDPVVYGPLPAFEVPHLRLLLVACRRLPDLPHPLLQEVGRDLGLLLPFLRVRAMP